MAAALARQMFGGTLTVGSAGVRKGELDGFAVAAMNEVGVDIAAHEPMTFEELEDLEDGLAYDLIVTLAPEAHHKALELTHRLPAAVEYWPTADRPRSKATGSSGSMPVARCATSSCSGSRPG